MIAAMDHKRSRSPEDAEVLDIQPLRDLARNFDIDIEPYLQEYLYYQSNIADGDSYAPNSGAPDNVPRSGEGNATAFATAALKIQNSTCIYTRKVDFLHQIVYEAHEALNEYCHTGTASNKNKKKISEAGDADIEEFRMYDAQMEFLLLDDVLPVDREGKKINLRPPRDSANIMNTTNLDGTLNDHTMHNVTLLSLGGIMSTTRPNDETFLISRDSISNTSPAAMSRMLLQNLHNEHQWRLIGSDVDQSGALVMPGAKKGVFVNGEVVSSQKNDDQCEGENVQIFPGGLSPQPHEETSAEFDSGDGYVENDFGGEDDGVGFEFNNDDTDMQDRFVEASAPAERQQPEMQERKPEQPKADPWATLDPHEPSRDKPNPLRIGVTFRLPPGIENDERPSACVTGSRTRSVKSSKNARRGKEEAKPWQVSPFVTDRLIGLEENVDDSSSGTQTSIPNLDWIFQVKEFLYGSEFAYLSERYAKHHETSARQRRLRQEEGEENGKEKVVDSDDHALYNDDFDDYGGGYDYGGDDDQSYENNDPALDDPVNNSQVKNRSNVDFDIIDDVFGTSGFHREDEENDVDNTSSQLTFEELCRAHLRKFAKSAEIYAAETQLTKRVGAWQNGLAPILEEQENRPEFNIHNIGREILQSVENKLAIRKRTVGGAKKLDTHLTTSNNSNSIGFRSITKDREEYEVCRLFLSTLMLCNYGNVIVHDGKDLSSTESLEIELLNSKFEASIDVFLAPSMEEEEDE
ncbi:hypothetical protein HJC23_009745 [Cyclotella cryptica]|uniref:Condensin-2 complex subunit H2 C-terminal domain-containing protein n=1 Tax=Cyclotella cryptica TaxID=29204 RepID=A0ABD3PPJ3_9STRA|eukprot:CCRYP_012890-RA/>CCRYP_012890-RA protein AED:0.00 eAED:0.00 QI:161/-1/1/1/-1/1/1/136/747